MWKLYDWQCTECSTTREHMVCPRDGEEAQTLTWLPCGCANRRATLHRRLVSAPAKYLGDRPMHPAVYGGNKDTAGYRSVPDYPELKEGITYEDREVADGRVQRTKVVKASALMEHQNTAQWREVHAAREAICDENATKRKRLPALKAGKVDLRNSKTPGDPRFTEKRKPTHAR